MTMVTPRELERRLTDLEGRRKRPSYGISLKTIEAELGIRADAFTPDGEDENGEPTVSVAQLIQNDQARTAIADHASRVLGRPPSDGGRGQR